MEAPVYIHGKRCGTLKIRTEGLRTVFEAECAPGGLVRLSVHGNGKCAYLGVLSPEGKLHRSLSKNELSRFPERIEYAADTELIKNSDVVWQRTQNGTLLSRDEYGTLIAIPADPAIGCRDRLRRIGDGFYLIFRK